MKLQGIITPMVTPLAAQNRLDESGLARLVDRLVSGGVSGLFLLGTTGEFPALSFDLRCELVRRTAEYNRGRLPLLVGITDTSYTDMLRFARFAAENGADALVLTAPYYFVAEGDQIRGWLKNVADNVELPLILYNMPGNTKVHFDLETVRFVMNLPRFIGMKDSSGNVDYFWRVCELARQKGDFPVLMGPEHLLGPAMKLGAAGGVNSGSNLCPFLFVEMYKAACAGDIARMTVMQEGIDLLNTLYRVAAGGMNVIRGLKTALAYAGVCDDFVAQPFTRVTDDERKKIEIIVAQLDEFVHKSR